MVKLYFMLSNLTNISVGNVNFSNGEPSFYPGRYSHLKICIWCRNKTYTKIRIEIIGFGDKKCDRSFYCKSTGTLFYNYLTSIEKAFFPLVGTCLVYNCLGF